MFGGCELFLLHTLNSQPLTCPWTVSLVPGPPEAHQGAGTTGQPSGALERHSAVQPRWLGSQMLRGAAGGGAAPPLHPTPKRPQENPLCLLHQAGVGVEFYEHKCQSSRSSANTLWKWPGKQMTKGLVCVSRPRLGCKVSVGFGSWFRLLPPHSP